VFNAIVYSGFLEDFEEIILAGIPTTV
jgi:hypothetical protein